MTGTVQIDWAGCTLSVGAEVKVNRDFNLTLRKTT